MNLPFSQACENNRQPILNVLRRALANSHRVLEIGSGTGQHAVFMSAHLPHLQWQPSDRAENIPGLQQWCQAFPQPNLSAPIQYDINDAWPALECDAVFSANTAHIMPWPTTCKMIVQVAGALPANGMFALYGPFNYRGQFTSDSNRNFDQHLKQSNPAQGLRDFEAVNALAQTHGLTLEEDNTMPANNRLLIWKKSC